MSEKKMYVSAEVEVFDTETLEEICALAGTCSKGNSTGGKPAPSGQCPGR